ncbi:MAG: alpha/beta hydrolase [Candidatus Dadabacteria bacterium]|nr:alpha/beta hydrolase [Candidatus Dadabacteria bacterium]
MNKFNQFLLVCFVLASGFILGCGSSGGGGDPAGCDDEDRYIQSGCFSLNDVVIDNDIRYTPMPRERHDGTREYLSFNIAYPSLEADTLAYRPLIILIHGGGFREDRPRKNQFDSFIVELAQRGFVAASIDYRLGLDESRELDCEEDFYNTPSAIYRATQDALSAVAYLKGNASEYGIDDESVFIGGASAGAITALHAAMAEQSEVDAVAPYLSEGLGPLRDDQDDYTVRGVVSMWGSVIGLRIIRADVPVIAFHGTEDDEVPYDREETGCSNIPYQYGSLPIHNELVENNVCTQLYTKVGGGHGVFLENGAEFIVEKAVAFLKSVLDDTCSTFHVSE